MNYKRGIQLSPQQRDQVLAQCPARYTGDHTPNWVYDHAIQKGLLYPVRFKNDLDWLVNTRFPVGVDGRLIDGFWSGNAVESPTYPEGDIPTNLD